MKFIKMLGGTQFFINVENITFIEQTNDGCKIHTISGSYIATDASYKDVVSGIEQALN